jgi:hypothetical protein
MRTLLTSIGEGFGLDACHIDFCSGREEFCWYTCLFLLERSSVGTPALFTSVREEFF